MHSADGALQLASHYCMPKFFASHRDPKSRVYKAANAQRDAGSVAHHITPAVKHRGGNPAIHNHCWPGTGGFASPPYDGFALDRRRHYADWRREKIFAACVLRIKSSWRRDTRQCVIFGIGEIARRQDATCRLKINGEDLRVAC